MRRRGFLRSVGVVTLAGSSSVASGHPESNHQGTGPSTTTEPATCSGFAPLATLPVEGAREAVVEPDGTTVYVAVADGFAVVDVADPTDPLLLAERRDLLADVASGPLRQVHDVAVDADHLLVIGPAQPMAGVVHAAVLFDIADPSDPHQLAVHRTDYPIHNGDLADGVAYLTATDGRTNPLVVVAMDGEAAADGPGILARWSLVDEDPAWADVPARVRPLHDVVVRAGVAYCSLWDAGTWLVDVGDPSNPKALGRVGERSAAELVDVVGPAREGTELPGNHHSAAVDEASDLLAVGHEAFDADGDGEGAPGGIDLVDVSSLNSPTRLATIEPPPTPDPTMDGVRTTAHNFELRDGVLYSAWFQGGVRIHDVSDPTAPREVAAWRDSGAASFWTAQFATDAVVASSMGTDSGEAGVYTFPIPPDGPTPVETETATEREPTTAGRPVPASPSPAGIGAGVAAVGGGLAWLVARRRRK